MAVVMALDGLVSLCTDPGSGPPKPNPTLKAFVPNDLFLKNNWQSVVQTHCPCMPKWCKIPQYHLKSLQYLLVTSLLPKLCLLCQSNGAPPIKKEFSRPNPCLIGQLKEQCCGEGLGEERIQILKLREMHELEAEGGMESCGILVAVMRFGFKDAGGPRWQQACPRGMGRRLGVGMLAHMPHMETAEHRGGLSWVI
ncbi:hypothetical protein JZ751_025928 [Albula glossodonta]|uniref:Uncharacterized protein n=1 Tax=Albula glossodonta TaxID=121402 RepID=A0A8T2NDL3_9TELE|nr:hypothetical protein JZ751_025928 [Albula glossodonta]